jgi:hypothetical protein
MDTPIDGLSSNLPLRFIWIMSKLGTPKMNRKETMFGHGWSPWSLRSIEAIFGGFWSHLLWDVEIGTWFVIGFVMSEMPQGGYQRALEITFMVEYFWVVWGSWIRENFALHEIAAPFFEWLAFLPRNRVGLVDSWNFTVYISIPFLFGKARLKKSPNHHHSYI